MVKNGNKGSFTSDSFVKPESGRGNLNREQTVARGEGERSFLEMEDLYRNSSEEMFLKYFMESSNAMAAPSMEMLGFKNLSHNFRHADSEELFKSWLTNGEASRAILSLLIDFITLVQIGFFSFQNQVLKKPVGSFTRSFQKFC